MTLDPKAPSMRLWQALRGRGVGAEEATALMNDYAHELAERQRAATDDLFELYAWTFHEDAFRDLIDVIDPKAQRAGTEGDTT